MHFINGIRLQFEGLLFGLRSPRLLLLGLLRFALLLVFVIAGATVALVWHDEFLALLWKRPDSPWIVWLWHLAAWLTALVLMMFSSVVAYLLSQVLFSVLIMDFMSRTTERLKTGNVLDDSGLPPVQLLFFLVRQEVPRAVLPILCVLALMLLGWLTPLAPVVSLLATAATAVFLAWDHTDLVPARRMQPFRRRLGDLMKALPFHLGFGLPLLIPVLNILLLSFAPVGATLYHLDPRRHSAITEGGTP